MNVGQHLDRLDKHRVFEIMKMPDGTFLIEECCDNNFSAAFTADELRELAQEIIELAGQ